MISRTALLLLPLLAVACDREAEAPAQEPSGVAAKGLDRSKVGKQAPDTIIKDADGEDSSLAEAAGKPMLVNIWATWCAPCVKELPTLDALSRRQGAPRVIAVSQDMAARASVDAFLEQHRIADLEAWHDESMALSGELGAQVLPTTIYYDSAGRELWRFVGDLDWTGPEAARLLAEKGPAASAN